MKIKTSELTDAALDWAVAKCEGYNVGVLTGTELLERHLDSETDPGRMAEIRELFAGVPAKPAFITDSGRKHTTSMELMGKTGCATMQFSTNPAQGLPIIERERLSTLWTNFGEQAFAWVSYLPNYVVRDGLQTRIERYGPTALIAAMRCRVASKLGDEVEVPEELLS